MPEFIPTGLVKWDSARRALAEAHSTDEVKTIRDQAEAIRLYYAQQSGSLEMQNQAAEIKLRAERRLGEMLGEMEKHEGGRPTENRSHAVSGLPPTLKQLGIAPMQSSRWQREATIPEDVFESYVVEAKRTGSELTSVGLLRIAQGMERNHRRADTPPLPATLFDVILADPPWEYRNSGGLPGQAENHYGTMSFDDICKLPIPAAENAALFLWVTNPMLREGLELAAAWGFEYKSNVVWVKTELTRPGIGFYVRGRHELLFICIRGSFVPDQTGHAPIGSVLEAPLQEHSRKPEAVYELIENIYPRGKYLELFARRYRDGWTSWGSDSSPLLAGDKDNS